LKKIILLFLLVLILVPLSADTMGYFAFAYHRDGRRYNRHVYAFVDHYAEVVVVVLDADNNWYLDQDEVYIYSVAVTGDQGNGVYENQYIKLVTHRNHDAELHIFSNGEEVVVHMRGTSQVPIQ